MLSVFVKRSTREKKRKEDKRGEKKKGVRRLSRYLRIVMDFRHP